MTKPSTSALLQSLAGLALVAAALFGSAGRFDIPEFWAYLAVWVAVTVFGFLAIDPDLAEERIRPGGRRLAPKYRLVVLIPLAHWCLAGLDRGRLHWSDTVPAALQVIALALFALAWIVVLWAMHVNRFFSSVVRIQHERGHYVVTAAPYRWVRHPGYAGAILATVTSGVALGSWLSLAVAVLAVPLILWRTIGEDRLLRDQLPGYRDYAAQVWYRLIPGLW